MRKQRKTRVRALSDSDLLEELIAELVDWLTTVGTDPPPPRLQDLFAALQSRRRGHGDDCVCFVCWPALYDVPEGF